MFNQQPPHSAVTHHHLTTISSSEVDNKESNTTNDGTSIEVVRKPRGRPPGSKNKRKLPVFVTKEPDSNTNMSPYVLEVSSGSDIIGAITRFCNKRNTGICVLSGSGVVSDVSFRQPTTTTAVTFRGLFELLSISATVLSLSPPPSMLTPFTKKDFHTKFAISIAGPKGQTFGGSVAGPLVAAGTIYIVAVSFNNPLYHRLPLEEEDDDDHVKNYGDRSVSVVRKQSTSSGGDDSVQHYAPSFMTTELLSMYSSHLPADVIWAPIPRQAPPHPSFY